ncbi:MAG: hypothetical protein J5732_00870 [Bacteroidaceae bacterium]|nr:hypothetical protein [Bacteroidaceae bacterium]
MSKPKYIIGIDPDVEKSGVAFLDVERRCFETVKSMAFPELMMYINSMHVKRELGLPFTKDAVTIVIEDSDSSTNWHLSSKMGVREAAATGRNVGLCNATQRHIKEWCEHLGFTVALQHPLKKSWMGRDGKITQEELMQFVPGLPKRINQECRDACLLAWNYANLPIRIPADFYNKKFDKEQIKKNALDEFKKKTEKEGEFLLLAGLKKRK